MAGTSLAMRMATVSARPGWYVSRRERRSTALDTASYCFLCAARYRCRRASSLFKRPATANVRIKINNNVSMFMLTPPDLL